MLLYYYCYYYRLLGIRACERSDCLLHAEAYVFCDHCSPLHSCSVAPTPCSTVLRSFFYDSHSPLRSGFTPLMLYLCPCKLQSFTVSKILSLPAYSGVFRRRRPACHGNEHPWLPGTSKCMYHLTKRLQLLGPCSKGRYT